MALESLPLSRDAPVAAHPVTPYTRVGMLGAGSLSFCSPYLSFGRVRLSPNKTHKNSKPDTHVFTPGSSFIDELIRSFIRSVRNHGATLPTCHCVRGTPDAHARPQS